MSNITQVVNVDRNPKTLKKGMHASDLSFKKLEKAVMDSLPEAQSKGKPTGLINNHSIGGKIAFADSKERDKLTTVNKRNYWRR